EATGRTIISRASMCRASTAPTPYWNGSPEASTQTCRPRCRMTSSGALSNGLGHGRAAPRMSGAARLRCLRPPNTISAASIKPRATGLNPSTPSSPMPTMDNQRGAAAVSRGLASGSGKLEGDMPRILILGGTTEARALGERLARRDGLDVTLSLAGRTASPVPHAVPVRVGGFGGTAGLADYLAKERIDALIDATHPFANIISANAAAAARQTAVPFIALHRPPWTTIAGDRWID